MRGNRASMKMAAEEDISQPAGFEKFFAGIFKSIGASPEDVRKSICIYLSALTMHTFCLRGCLLKEIICILLAVRKGNPDSFKISKPLVKN